ncbi:translocation/assembly module TamB domain-containing protein, partial [Halorubrum tibetense]
EFGISDITVEDGNDGGSSIAAGKRLTEKLYVKYVYGLLGAAGNFVVQYKISDQLGIETTSGDSQAIDLTYRWDSKPPEKEKKAPVSESVPIQ